MNLIIAKSQPATPAERDPRWTALVNRDPAFDGKFVYSVKTTGVYCRPTCPSRLAKPENIAFHADCTEAERAGFRPCLRCRPNDAPLAERHAAIVAEACRRIEASEELPMLDALAKAAGISPYHFHRLFKSITGLTPKAYGAAHRTRRIRDHLAEGKGSVTEAIYDAGFSSSSRFYETSNKVLGMTPSAFRAGGVEAEIKFAVAECSLGAILVAASGKGVCAIFLGDDPDQLVRDLQDRFPKANLIGGNTEFEALVAKVVGFVEAPAIGLDLPLDVRGTAFQERVWQALRDIPAGETASYTDIATRIGAPKAVRAVAQACAANTLAVAIPCHRVVRQDGNLSGYRWGVERKRALLTKERG
ncbi:bifunctional DNA-binding transcriptional regulator/O6-methylguanine-DNA methyltransferase Ada [Phyllobacterium leguminum]|uniref:DNA-O6-methylguanine--protein-cysteine S-methyltransferase /transcriptional regulator Ada n=1 Tax=Phyllobacterium leguminum TaxID=314237 RepID=A0A318T0T2_9HYPH|nr:bifunctional DNA-binding transcriptional regulator/O6-methylguanine-DNA methyltransferase Ada [Phyllobacterium leguminum]PYE86356.1 DNA-O6-methylguanine--protein-cysteine S-methyltransferase /transcriptional regulator Ada [Phyllobacterium leguminum]